jgi:YD repeat-containing protein
VASRPEPLLAERVWAHPSAVAFEEVTATVEHDDAGRVVAVRYSDGEGERYGYDDAGRLVTIEEHPSLWSTVAGPAHRWDAGGTLTVEHDERGPVRIAGPHGAVWTRNDEPWPELLARGADAFAERCAATLAAAPLTADTALSSLVVMYVGDGGLAGVVLTAGTDAERQEALAGDDPDEMALALWYPEPPELSFLEVEEDVDLDALLLQEAALNDPREAQRTVLTEAAKLLARRDWAGVFTPTDDFVVFVAEHDEGFSEKHASVREVNPPERLAAWDAAWPAGVARDDDE